VNEQARGGAIGGGGGGGDACGARSLGSLLGSHAVSACSPAADRSAAPPRRASSASRRDD